MFNFINANPNTNPKIKFKYISYKLYIIKNNHIPPYYALLIHYQQNKKNLISSQMDSPSFTR